jgi:hypothetical protein
MAARKDGLHSERVRQRIRVSQLVNRLQKNALGEVEMSASQVDSAKFLINKVMANPPERKELTGPDGGSIPLGLTVEFVNGAHPASDEA